MPNIHIVQCDDPKYLPFARSRLKQLRATGLAFASQQYTVDGVTVHVRKEGEQEYIRISGGTRLWVLVNVVKTTAVGGDPYAITKTRSKLFHLSAGPTNTKGAKLVYQGEQCSCFWRIGRMG